MNWINAFELICYIIVVIMLVDLIRKKDINSLFTFGAAALVGFIMELLAVSVTDIYYYSNDFWISIGVVPYQFPFFGGLMWCAAMVLILVRAIRLRLMVAPVKCFDVPMILFWSALYLYCLAGIICQGIHAIYVWFLILGIAFMAGTLYVCMAEPREG